MELLPSPSPSCLSAASRCAASCGDTSTETELTHPTARKRLSQPGEHPCTLPSGGAGPQPGSAPNEQRSHRVPVPGAAHTGRAALVCNHSSETQIARKTPRYRRWDLPAPRQNKWDHRESASCPRRALTWSPSVNTCPLEMLRVPEQPLCPRLVVRKHHHNKRN